MDNIEKKIITTAVSLFKKDGYNETSVNKICATCGITKGTFYYHFNAKSDLIYRYYEMLYNDILSIMPELIVIKDAKTKLWKLYEYSIDNTVLLTASVLNALLIADAQNGLRNFSPMTGDKVTISHQTQSKLIHELIIQAQDEGSIAKDKNPLILMETYNAVIVGMALDWSSHNGKYDQKEKLKEMFDILFC